MTNLPGANLHSRAATARKGEGQDGPSHFPRYPEYKDSGVEWLGAVPAHWGLMRLKRLTSCLDGKRVPLNSEQRSDKQGEVPYWGANAVMDYVDEALFDEELVLLGEDGAPFFDRTRSVAFRSTGPVWPNNHIHVLRPLPGVTAQFLVHCLNSTDYAEFIDGSTRDKLTQSQMGAIPIPCPTAEEQMAICNFLGVETARVDGLISEQEKLIALLKEKRQAVISHAVTKGLDPNVPMKDSGIEWLGEVPAHWTVMPIRYAARLESGHTPSRSHPEYWENCTVPWFTLADIWQFRNDVNEYATETKELVSELGLANSAARLLPAGTVMLSRTASVGFSGIMGVPMATTQDFANWVCGEKVSSEFLLYVFRAMKDEFRKLMYGSTHNTIYMPDIQMFRFACPPREEQQIIVDWIRGLNRRLDELLSEAECAVGLLRERRSALISSAVTGKIKVID